jgi:hypothetical protein
MASNINEVIEQTSDEIISLLGWCVTEGITFSDLWKTDEGRYLRENVLKDDELFVNPLDWSYNSYGTLYKKIVEIPFDTEVVEGIHVDINNSIRNDVYETTVKDNVVFVFYRPTEQKYVLVYVINFEHEWGERYTLQEIMKRFIGVEHHDTLLCRVQEVK